MLVSSTKNYEIQGVQLLNLLITKLGAYHRAPDKWSFTCPICKSQYPATIKLGRNGAPIVACTSGCHEGMKLWVACLKQAGIECRNIKWDDLTIWQKHLRMMVRNHYRKHSLFEIGMGISYIRTMAGKKEVFHCSVRDIQIMTGWSLGTISKKIYELRRIGLLKLVELGIGPYANTYRLITPNIPLMEEIYDFSDLFPNYRYPKNGINIKNSDNNKNPTSNGPPKIYHNGTSVHLRYPAGRPLILHWFFQWVWNGHSTMVMDLVTGMKFVTPYFVAKRLGYKSTVPVKKYLDSFYRLGLVDYSEEGFCGEPVYALKGNIDAIVNDLWYRDACFPAYDRAVTVRNRIEEERRWWRLICCGKLDHGMLPAEEINEPGWNDGAGMQ